MISWKYSFEKISKDLELAKKKKQTLDNLFSTGRISQSTFDSLNTELSRAIVETEARQKELAGQMSSKVAELEEQISTLEMLLASSELQYAAGEIDDELHTHESKAFSLGLEATKQELTSIKTIVSSILQEHTSPPPQLQLETHEMTGTPKAGEVTPEPLEIKVETPLEEKPIEVPAEAKPETPIEAPHETTVETVTEKVTETTVEAKTENPTEPTAETPTTSSATEIPVEAPKEETTLNEGMTIEVIKEIKEEQIISSEPIAEKIVEEAPATEMAASPSEAPTFFRDPKEAVQEKSLEEKEESKG